MAEFENRPGKHSGDAERLANAFADPNSRDDARLGKSFEESNSSSRKKKPYASVAQKTESHARLYIFVIAAVIAFALLFLLGWLPRHREATEARKNAEAVSGALPLVDVMRVQHGAQGAGVTVPGTASALTEAYVYARANGYLKKRLVDIGDHVRAGQLLAVVDSPELDQQVDQARAQVRQAEAQWNQQKAQQKLTRVNAERARTLVAEGVFSKQKGDEAEADFGVQEANVAAAERNVQALRANLRRTQDLQRFEQVTAPFAGVITQRNADVGALISTAGAAGGAQTAPQSNVAGSSGNGNQSATNTASAAQGGPLFGVAQVDRLRVLVSVPEAYAAAVRVGAPAQIRFQAMGQQLVTGTIMRTSGGLDQNTRTLATEIEVANNEGKLKPGMYAVATLSPATGSPAITIPGDAIAIRKDRPVVAVVTGDIVHIVPVTLGRDFGSGIEILAGLKDGDVLVTNVSDAVVEGAKVQVHPVK